MNEKMIRRLRQIFDEMSIAHFIQTDELTGVKSMIYVNRNSKKHETIYITIDRTTLLVDLPF